MTQLEPLAQAMLIETVDKPMEACMARATCRSAIRRERSKSCRAIPCCLKGGTYRWTWGWAKPKLHSPQAEFISPNKSWLRNFRAHAHARIVALYCTAPFLWSFLHEDSALHAAYIVSLLCPQSFLTCIYISESPLLLPHMLPTVEVSLFLLFLKSSFPFF
jgi:hypothetical protein